MCGYSQRKRGVTVTRRAPVNGRGRRGGAGGLMLALLWLAAPLMARAQTPATVPALPALPGREQLALSYSGQFVVTGSAEKSPLLRLPSVTTNANFVRLEPALLSVSAERIKQSLYRTLGVPVGPNWQGKIYLALRPALYTDEQVTVVARPIDRSWSYLVQLPDVVAADRYMRGMTGALLLELANRRSSADGHCAELPAWLIDGLSRQLLRNELAKVVVTAPQGVIDQPTRTRPAAHDHELDPLAAARQVLRKHAVLTYEQMCWPTVAQIAGQDGGVYQASAQLLVVELLRLNDGPARLRKMLEILPQGYNWQTAFQVAFRQEFPRPVDLEKWWALAATSFQAHEPGAAWTPAYSASRLNELLQVPVAIRATSNALPRHASIPLQAVVRDFSPAHQTEVLEARLHDLRMAELRMAHQYIALTDEYCQVLAGYLGESLAPPRRVTSGRRAATAVVHLRAREFVRRLDALDARRRTVEAGLQTARQAG